MKLCVIGLGQAGGKILDNLVMNDYQSETGIIAEAVAINTASADLHGLENIPEENRVLIGETRVNGHGVGADNELGATVAEEDSEIILNSVDSVPTHEIDAFLLIAGLGGGTGSGTLPVVAKHLKRIYAEPVYGLGILPGKNEGGIYTLNAARSLQTCVRECDNLLLFDNDAWTKSGESLGAGFEEMNTELTNRLLVLFGAGETHNTEDIAESVVDASEIINTLSSGGISTIGYATSQLNDQDAKGGLLSRLRRNKTSSADADPNRITSLIRKATLGRLTVPVENEGVERALVIAAGPSNALSRKGIEKARNWIEEETGSMEVRGGDYPVDSDHLAGLVLLSGVPNIPRIKELQGVAVEAGEAIEEANAKHDDRLDSLVHDTDGDVDPLF